MKKALIIGGAGYIGSHINKLLSAGGVKTVVYDNFATGHRRLVRWGRLVEGELSDRGRLLACLRREKIDSVLHFAASAAVGESVADPAKYYNNNVANTIGLLDAMRAAGARKLIFSSSAAVYGAPERVPVPETHPRSPVNPYGRTKLMMEEAIADYSRAYGLKFCCLRYFNAAGADPDGETGELHDPETHLIPLALRAAAGGPALKVFGGDYATPDGTCVRDYVHVSDLADAHYLALKRLWSGGGSGNYNLGNGRGYSVRRVIGAVGRISGVRVPFELAPRRAGDPAALVASSARARRELGWKPRLFKLEDIVSTAWAWHRAAYKNVGGARRSRVCAPPAQVI